MKVFCKYSLSGGGNFNPTNPLIKGFLSLLLITSTLTACNDAEDAIPTQASNKLNLSVKVNPSSRAMVQGTTLASGQSVSVNVTAADGGNYDGKTTGYLNVAYTASGDGTQQSPQTWAPTTNPILLSGTEGKMYVYYPWTDQVDYKAIPVDVTTQTDWMYAEDEYTVSDTQANTEIILSHAQTAVSINVTRDASYTGAGLIEALTVTSEGLASAGTLDTRDGTFSNVSGANTPISIIDESFTLDGTTSSSQENAYMLIPASDQTKDFTITATLDGKTYSHTVTMSEAFIPGKVYKVNVTFTNTGIKVSQVSLVDWNETTLPETTFEPFIPNSWDNLPNGIYAVSGLGKPIDEANADESCIGVALIANDAPTPQKFIINIDKISNIISCWDETDPDSPYYDDYHYISIPEFAKVDGTNGGGYLEDLNTDYTIWTSGALSDFNGKDNTKTIEEMAYRGICGFEENGYDGDYYWYVPALGQLALINLYKDKINEVLKKMNCNTLPVGGFWSSTQGKGDCAWYIDFYTNYISYNSKFLEKMILYIRDID